MTTRPFNTVDIIQQITNQTKVFKFVAGTAELARIIDMENITPNMMPACFVVLKETTYDENEGMNTSWQLETNYFDCVIVLDNTVNGMDSSGNECYVDYSLNCLPDLRRCILNWVPPFNSPTPITHEHNNLDTMTQSRLMYTVTFKCDVNISADDGYISPQYPDWSIDSAEISGDTGGINNLITK